MKRLLTLNLWTLVVFAALPSIAAAADPPTDYVMAIYFHRTERCPTCKKMGSFADEAIKKEFADQVKAGTVKFKFVDFQKNPRVAKAYKVEGPALIVAKVEGKKAKKYRDLDGIWIKVNEKSEFMKYVCTNIKAYMK